MNASPYLNRRNILQYSLFGAGPLLGLGRVEGASPIEGETDHFWYRLAPQEPYLDSQHSPLNFGFDAPPLSLSADNGKTWPHRSPFPDATNITFSQIFENRNVLFATRNQLFLSTDNLKTYHPITVQDLDGGDYLPHKPLNPEQPGWDGHPREGVHTWEVNGSEMLVWGNYCNVMGGPVPVNIYYSTDQGKTVKIAYSFGQNPRFQQPGAKPEDFLGNPDNSTICRHLHSVMYHPEEDAFYACSGDIDRGHGNECHWLRGKYDAPADSWKWEVIVSSNANSRFKSGGINFVDGKVYWAADANGPKTIRETYDRGIFRCDPADIPHPEKHTRLFNPEYESANMIIQDNVILSAHYATASPYTNGFIISTDLGKSWAQYDLKEFGKRSGTRFQRKNSEGWFLVDLRKGWIERGETLWIKPKV